RVADGDGDQPVRRGTARRREHPRRVRRQPRHHGRLRDRRPPDDGGDGVRRVFVDPEAPQRDAIEEAAKWIRLGEIVALPTDTLYGLAVDPFNAAAVDRLFEAKGRPADRGIPLIAADRAQIEEHIEVLTPLDARLADRFWLGPLTLLLPAPHAMDAAVS